MILTAILSLNLIGRWLAPPIVERHVGPWTLTTNPDRFSGTVGCSISARGVTLQRDTLIFRLGGAADTTRGVYRIDDGPPRAVSEAFDAVEAKGFFPQRGWIVDPEGGEVALPAASLSNARRVTLSAYPRRGTWTFKVDRLAEARALAKAAGCAAAAS